MIFLTSDLLKDMTDLKLKKRSGTIISFQHRTSSGVVKVGKSRHRFFITSWRCGRVVRYPESGNAVDVVFSESGRLISVWLV